MEGRPKGIKQQGDHITVHSVCKMETTKNTYTTTTVDAVFTGAFDSAYRGDIVMPGKAGNFNLEEAMKKQNEQKR